MTRVKMMCLTLTSLVLATFAPSRPPSDSVPPSDNGGLWTEREAVESQEVSGRIVDVLGRAVAGVGVRVEWNKGGDDKRPLGVTTSDERGRYLVKVPIHGRAFRVKLEKDGYRTETLSYELRRGREDDELFDDEGRRPADSEVALVAVLNRREAFGLWLRTGEDLEKGTREVLATYEWSSRDASLFGHLFQHQEHFRPAMLRLIEDERVGSAARYWLDLLGDPRDERLFRDPAVYPEGRELAPTIAARKVDLVEALKSAAGQLDWNAVPGGAGPRMTIEVIAFNEGLDRAYVECGINLTSLSGTFWRFVFNKSGDEWVLRSMESAGAV